MEFSTKLKWRRRIKWLFERIIIPIAIASIIIVFIQKYFDVSLTKITQQYVYYNALATKKINYSEQLIVVRQKSLTWLDKNSLAFFKNDSLDYKSWSLISEDVKNTNSGSLLYSLQPYNAILNFDDSLRIIVFKLLNNEYQNYEQYKIDRKRLGSKYDILINVLRENTISDSAFTNFINKSHYDVDRE